MARGEGRVGRDRGAAVPGADVLADVAAEDVGADAGALRLGDRAAQLDGEVRDAEADRASRPSPGTMAAVGQASMQRVQVPQRSGGGASGAISSDTSSSPRKNHEPCC